MSSHAIVKRVEFPAGHRLMNYDGKCRNIHGHSFIAEVRITSTVLDKMGFVIDFTDLGHFLKKWIDTNWDHALLINYKDKDLIKFVQKVDKTKHYIMPCNPTTENMAKYLHSCVLMEKYFPKIKNNKLMDIPWVRIWESNTAYAEYYG